MQSRLLIDIDGGRRAVIAIKGIRLAADSDDVKDKLVRQFIEDVSCESHGLVSVFRDGENDAFLRPAPLETVMWSLHSRLGGDSTDSGKKMRELIDMEFGSVSGS